VEGFIGQSEGIFELGYAKPILPRCQKVNIKLTLGDILG